MKGGEDYSSLGSVSTKPVPFVEQMAIEKDKKSWYNLTQRQIAFGMNIASFL